MELGSGPEGIGQVATVTPVELEQRTVGVWLVSNFRTVERAAETAVAQLKCGVLDVRIVVGGGSQGESAAA